MRFGSGYDATGVESYHSEQEKEMAANSARKCAHPVCSCEATEGKFCIAACEAMEKTPDIDCHCGQAGCKVKTR